VILWPQSLGGRLTLAFALAIVAVIVLAYTVESMDDGPAPTKRAKPSVLSHAQTGGVVGAVPQATANLGSSGWGQNLPVLRPVTGTILLATSEAALAPDIRPVLEILADGDVVLRRSLPLAKEPVAVAPLSRDGHGVGIVLPTSSLSGLPVAARGALIGMIQQLLLERPVLPANVCSSDVEMDPQELRRLLSWVP
jgi:hypothetical protein